MTIHGQFGDQRMLCLKLRVRERQGHAASPATDGPKRVANRRIVLIQIPGGRISSGIITKFLPTLAAPAGEKDLVEWLSADAGKTVRRCRPRSSRQRNQR